MTDNAYSLHNIKIMNFEFDNKSLALAIFLSSAFWLIWKFKSKFLSPKIFVSDLEGLKISKITWKQRCLCYIRHLDTIALGFFLLALIDPHLQIPRKDPLTPALAEGIAIYILADQSGSMNEKTSAGASRVHGTNTKIDLLKKIAKDFVLGSPEAHLQERSADLIGLIGFARTAHVLVPLTLDHELISDAISNLQVVKNKSEDGTATGYAIYKAVNIIAATRHYSQELAGSERPAYKIKNSVILLISDGFQEPNPLDKGSPQRNIGLEEAAEYAKEKNVRIYVINVEPAFNAPQFIPHRHLMEKITELTGGQFYLMQDTTQLSEVFATLNKLEKSIVPQAAVSPLDLPKDLQPNRYKRVSLYPYLIAIGMAILFSSVLVRAAFFKEIP